MKGKCFAPQSGVKIDPELLTSTSAENVLHVIGSPGLKFLIVVRQSF